MSCGVIRNNLPCSGYNECFENNGIREGMLKTYHKEDGHDEYYLYKEIPYINGQRQGEGYVYLNLTSPIIQTTLYYEDDKLQKMKYMTHPNNYITLEFDYSPLNITHISSVVFSGDNYKFMFNSPFGGSTGFFINNSYNYMLINVFETHITYVFNNNTGHIDFGIYI